MRSCTVSYASKIQRESLLGEGFTPVILRKSSQFVSIIRENNRLSILAVQLVLNLLIIQVLLATVPHIVDDSKHAFVSQK